MFVVQVTRKMVTPSLETIALWWYEYFQQGDIGKVAVVGGAAAAYYAFGNPIEAIQIGDYAAFAKGYAVGAVVSTGIVTVGSASDKQ